MILMMMLLLLLRMVIVVMHDGRCGCCFDHIAAVVGVRHWIVAVQKHLIV
jgi:hypothetical protein